MVSLGSPPRTIDPETAQRLRMLGQGIRQKKIPSRSVLEVVRGTAGLQAQDTVGMALSIRARSSGLWRSDVSTAQMEQRSVVRTWAMRGTLHLVAADDLGWLLRLLSPGIRRAQARRVAALGLDEETFAQAERVMRRELAGGPLTRPELATRLAAAGVDPSGQRIAHLVQRAAIDAVICHGPDRGGRPTLVLLADWISFGPALPRRRALAEVARVFLNAFGPAEPRDLATWSGLPAGESAAAIDSIASDYAEVRIGDRSAWVPSARLDELASLEPAGPTVRLLGAFDTLLLGYRDRSALIDPINRRRVNAGGGMVAPTLLVDGRVLGTWRHRRTRQGLEVRVEPFDTLTRPVELALAAEVADVRRFLGDSRH